MPGSMSNPIIQQRQQSQLPQLMQSFLGRLPESGILAFDQATADLDPITRHPDFLRQDRASREQYVRDYLMTQVPELSDVFHGLAPEAALGEYITQQVLGPPTFAQTTGRSIYDIGVPLATTGAAILGARLTGGSPQGAATLGGAGYAASEPLLRRLTDLPEPSLGAQAVNTAIQGVAQGLYQGGVNLMTAGAERLVGGPVRTTLLGTPFRLSPQEAQTFRVLGEGSDLLGRTGTGMEGTMTPGQMMRSRGTPTAGTFIEEMMRNSLGGASFSTRQLTRARQAGEAVLAKYTNTIDAMNDARDAATAIVEGHHARVPVAAQARKEAYNAFGAMSASVPPQDTSNIVTPFLAPQRRPDIENLSAILKRDIPPDVAQDVFGLLRTQHQGPLPTLPPGAIRPNMPVSVQGNPGIYHGPGPTPDTVMVSFPQLPGRQGPLQVLASEVEAQGFTDEASYANISLFSSIMGGVQRAGEHAASAAGRLGRGMGNEDLIAAGRTAGWLKAQAETILTGTQVPQEVREARELVGRIYREENETFYTPLVQGLVAKFRAYPDTFARELIKTDNSDVLAVVHKAVEAMPRFNAGTVTDPVQRVSALSRDSQYLLGSTYWDTRIRPQLQVQLLKDHLSPPDPGVSGGLAQMERVVMASPTRFTDPRYVQENLFSIEAPALLKRMDDMTQATRRAVFGSEAQFQQLYQIATALRQAQTSVGGTGSMVMTLRQIGGATILGGAVGGIIAGQATGDPWMTGAAALTGLALPVVLAAKMTDPAFVRRLVFGIRNPTTGTATRVFGELGKDMGRFATSVGATLPTSAPALPGFQEEEPEEPQ